jgi:hypothetical protein
VKDVTHVLDTVERPPFDGCPLAREARRATAHPGFTAARQAAGGTHGLPLHHGSPRFLKLRAQRRKLAGRERDLVAKLPVLRDERFDHVRRDRVTFHDLDCGHAGIELAEDECGDVARGAAKG